MNNLPIESISANIRLISITESTNDAIVVAEHTGNIILWNKAAESMFGYQKEEAIGNDLTIIMPAEYRPAHNKGMSRFVKTGEKRVIGKTIEIIAQKKSGEIFPIELSLSSWKEKEEIFVCGIIRDISIRKENERLIKSSLKEKEILLKEVHHRVKNNFQIIISLLKLYSQNLAEDSLQVFKECQDKIHSMALVHSSIYISEDFVNVDLSNYTNSFCNYFISLLEDHKLKIIKDFERVYISMDKAVNFGLILSELLTNFYKHGVSKNPNPTVKIHLSQNGDSILFNFQDNGPGIPSKFLKRENLNSYGLEMIHDLVEQMNGNIKIDSFQGTKFRIILNADK